MATTIASNLARPEPQALKSTIDALAARFGNRVVTSQAVREQHGHTTTWLTNQPPDAVVMAQETADIQDVVRICAKHGVPVIPFGTGTSLEGQVNAPAGGVCIDLREMNRILEVHADDLDCVIEPGVTRKALNEHLRDQGLFFPIDPGADASIGGMASTRASGTNAVRYGTMKDNILALKVVRADGEIITMPFGMATLVSIARVTPEQSPPMMPLTPSAVIARSVCFGPIADRVLPPRWPRVRLRSSVVRRGSRPTAAPARSEDDPSDNRADRRPSPCWPSPGRSRSSAT